MTNSPKALSLKIEETSIPFVKIFEIMENVLGDKQLPSVSAIVENISKKDKKNEPYQILISTILSLRTKDEVTYPASDRLFKQAGNPRDMLNLSAETIEKIIFPVGFYKTKSRNILKISKILMDRYNGGVPQEREPLLELPGVGLKTANLVLSLAYNLPYICVDIHVHRISNRLGWINTKNPNESEAILHRILPLENRARVNELMVLFGQNICRPTSPFCSRCPLSKECPRKDVTRNR